MQNHPPARIPSALLPKQATRGQACKSKTLPRTHWVARQFCSILAVCLEPSQHLTQPTETHLKAARHVLRCPKHTSAISSHTLKGMIAILASVDSQKHTGVETRMAENLILDQWISLLSEWLTCLVDLKETDYWCYFYNGTTLRL